MSITAALMLVAGGLGMSGIVTTALDFDTGRPLFAIGLMAVGVAAMCVLTGLLASHRTRILRSFDVGYRAGFHDGQRAGLVVVPFDRRERTR